MCGVIGMVGKSPVNQALYDGLTVLQHRGQDAAGIMTYDNGRLHLRKDNGLVRDVFSAEDMLQLRGNVGIGHCRYPTAGCSSSAESQPFYVNSPYGISIAHNGNLTNASDIKRDLFLADLRHINTSSDSEVLLNAFAHKLGELGKLRVSETDIFDAVANIHERCRGGYAAIAMINGYGILGFRDPNGIRPLCYGSRDTDAGTEYMIASESVALDVLGFTLIRDVAPGEAVLIDLQGNLYTRQCAAAPQLAPCIFEYVYLARPDSMLDDVSVYKSRLRMGRTLAGKIRREWAHHDIDVVIPIPDTSRTAALDLANDLNILYREGFIKNRYIGRTFIMPGQAVRKKSVRQKLNPIELEFRGKNVLLLDDSIVRGTTSEQIIQMAREAGANKVFFASAAPPVRYPNVYGIDMPAAQELIAHNRSVEEIRAVIGADDMIYQDLDDLVEAVRGKNTGLREFDCSCFDGRYVTGDITAEYLLALETERADAMRVGAPLQSNRLAGMNS
ncbi:amidophosphoribosyltransferase [Spiribacter sp. C176]|uniref:Amidophosphoribosyltransferase n=1 Tax=Spiribacter salilacus TaxID=2664894 RepID=A0A6N7QTM7_9GAMM|nr:amidophosphoribosyltransferase [Spiribacter salilacus]MRH78759.1 amidophosphoribosyltransferase [Spiribacter salilacus]